MARWEDVTETTVSWLLPCVPALKHTAAADACLHLYFEHSHTQTPELFRSLTS